MSNYEFEGYADGDWDSPEELAWNEFDWQQYLNQNEKEISAFLTHYHGMKHRPDHLDEIAKAMGWSLEDWTPGGLDEIEEPDQDPGEGSAFDPYTVHRHPVYIVTRGLYQHLFLCWEQFTSQNHRSLSPILAGRLPASLHAGELNAIMAINALDMGDFTLAVCHLKNALGALNHSMALVQQIQLKSVRQQTLFQAESMAVFFDLREVWLRVINDCRAEEKRQTPDEED